ncbi:Multisite-specific tRNA:(cytosine-C(5))-methyltransferase [Hypsizygus marmoreus]|uniref:Multisite-specific tRNA:(Cytosine-C(5))-methyltransferase n=1 Tax=Hypsizygus marmoreus TaxID=39966 RepID=A0A369JQ31_HYPMA|nr:Multisite-specific tRNA:(cytosine-C(5))-methyltransferase [Hypsizygus marmoreus]
MIGSVEDAEEEHSSDAEDINEQPSTLIPGTVVPHLLRNLPLDQQLTLSPTPGNSRFPKKVLPSLKSPEFKRFHSFLVFETEVVCPLSSLLLESPNTETKSRCTGKYIKTRGSNGYVRCFRIHNTFSPLPYPLPFPPPIPFLIHPFPKQTAQLLEALHAQDSITTTSILSGLLLLANDSDHRRTHLLIHQSARLPRPALMVTNLDASVCPIIKVPASPFASSSSTDTQLTQLLFDRVLCDVPCSGDGTMRKNMGIWKSWQPMDGNGLHRHVVLFLPPFLISNTRVKLLHPSGRIVYSTCSLHPVENKRGRRRGAQCQPRFPPRRRLIQAPRAQTAFRHDILAAQRRQGRHHSYATYAEFLSSDDAKEGTKLTKGTGHLRTLRIYPHLQDTGVFFVTVLERKSQAVESFSVSMKKREAEEPEEVPETKKPRLAGDDEEVKLAEDDINMTPIESEEKRDDSALATKSEEGASSMAPNTKPARSKKENRPPIANIIVSF